MSAHIRSLNVLAENVRAALRDIERHAFDRTLLPEHLNAAREQLAADVREVRADVDRIFDTGEGW